MKRILLIEDDPAIRDIVNIVFSGEDFEVVMHNNGEQVLQDDFELPDLFIIDRQLPGASGLDICRHIKRQERLKHIPVVMFSASPCIQESAREAGADEAITKPFSLELLRKTVFSCLSR